MKQPTKRPVSKRPAKATAAKTRRKPESTEAFKERQSRRRKVTAERRARIIGNIRLEADEAAVLDKLKARKDPPLSNREVIARLLKHPKAAEHLDEVSERIEKPKRSR